MFGYESPTAKIYVDALSVGIASEAAFQGVDIAAAYADIVPETEVGLVRPAAWNETYINVDKIAAPNVSGDINIILTRRSLVTDRQITSTGKIKKSRGQHDDVLLGYSLIYGERVKKRIAFVDVTGIEQTEIVVAHEIGHLLDMTMNTDTEVHCGEANCVMSKTLHDEHKEWGFCNSCAEQLEYKAVELAAYKRSVGFLVRKALVWV